MVSAFNQTEEATELEITINLPRGTERVALTGVGERNLKLIRESLGVKITARNGQLRISGESGAVSRAAQVVEQLGSAARGHRPLDRQRLLEIIAATDQASESPVETDTGCIDPDPFGPDQLDVYLQGRSVRALTEGQQRYLQAILTHDLTFCVGPAGTGKTYLAVAAAVAMLHRGSVRRLALVRPAVEAGEKLGFLPGDMQEKVNPYLRPLIDALNDMMTFDQIQRFMAGDVIEVIPLAFMRGRTLNDTVIILDEAQNTTAGQMLMFLTRLGHGGKMIVTGDTTQIDLEEPQFSGLIDGISRLRRIKGVAMVTLDGADIVRHSLVQRIVEAYGQEPRSSGPRVEFHNESTEPNRAESVSPPPGLRNFSPNQALRQEKDSDQ